MEEEKNGLVEESRVKSEEPGGFAEESRVKSEESSEDVIYEIPEESESSESSEDSENAEDSECLSEAETSLREMVAEMGAERVLEIIRDNRNAAIRQILSEVEAQRAPLQSGVSVGQACSSIFDLAAMA